MSHAGGGAAFVVWLRVVIEIGRQRIDLARPVILLLVRDLRDRLECVFRPSGQKFEHSQADMLMHLGRRLRCVRQPLLEIFNRLVDVLSPIVRSRIRRYVYRGCSATGRFVGRCRSQRLLHAVGFIRRDFIDRLFDRSLSLTRASVEQTC